MPKWTLDQIQWDRFSPADVDPDMLKIVKAAAMVEYNSADYASYLCNIFKGDEGFQKAARVWAREEAQHGLALARWATLADPSFDFPVRFKRFTDGFKIPIDMNESVRGSRTGELISRCIVEMGTSSYYTALGEAAREPVLKEICRHIAADEFRHHRLFYTHGQRYQESERPWLVERMRVALGRILEAEDDELSYAYYAANIDDVPYDRKACSQAYIARAYGYYKPWIVERMVAMAMKSAGIKPRRTLSVFLARWVWRYMKLRRNRLMTQVA